MTWSVEYVQSRRQAGYKAGLARKQVLFPEHVPRILRDRDRGLTQRQIAKKWGVTNQALSMFLKREGVKWHA